MFNNKTSKQMRQKRLARIRAKVSGTGDRPRLTVYRSNYALYVQCVDDEKGSVLFSRSAKGKNKETAEKLGADVAAVCKKKGITNAVFDRSGYQYHGVIAALADAVRAGGVTI